MKAKLRGKIKGFENDANAEMRLVIESDGKVDTGNIAAQFIALYGTIRMKSIIANQMKIGANITITISDEEQE